jgi:hypothetical protein
VIFLAIFVLLAALLVPGFLLGLLFDPENGDDMFLRNVGI